MIEMNKEDRLLKNKRIAETQKATKERRWKMKVITRDVKLLTRYMSKEQRYHLENLFMEAKQYRNTIIANDCKEMNQIILKDWSIKNIKYLSSQMKQSVFKQVQQDIFNLAKLKEKWYKVWKLKFCSEVNSIDLKQFWNSFRIKWNKIRIQWIERLFYVKWIHQLDITNWEIANAKLVRKSDWYHLMITNYINYTEEDIIIHWSIWIDTWMKNQLTLNNWIQIDFIQFKDIPKREHKRLKKKVKYSRWWKRSKQSLWRKYLKLKNRRKDRLNKIANVFKNTNVILEDIDYREWQKNWWKKYSELTFRKLLEKLKYTTIIDKYYASTKICSECWNKKEEIWLKERTYQCEKCWMKKNRDLNAAINIFNKWIEQLKNKEINQQITKIKFEKVLNIKIRSI